MCLHVSMLLHEGGGRNREVFLCESFLEFMIKVLFGLSILEIQRRIWGLFVSTWYGGWRPETKVNKIGFFPSWLRIRSLEGETNRRGRDIDDEAAAEGM